MILPLLISCPFRAQSGAEPGAERAGSGALDADAACVLTAKPPNAARRRSAAGIRALVQVPGLRKAGTTDCDLPGGTAAVGIAAATLKVHAVDWYRPTPSTPATLALPVTSKSSGTVKAPAAASAVSACSASGTAPLSRSSALARRVSRAANVSFRSPAFSNSPATQTFWISARAKLTPPRPIPKAAPATNARMHVSSQFFIWISTLWPASIDPLRRERYECRCACCHGFTGREQQRCSCGSLPMVDCLPRSCWPRSCCSRRHSRPSRPPQAEPRPRRTCSLPPWVRS